MTIDQENHKLNQTNLLLEPHDYRIYYVNIDLHHQYGISVAESQTLAKRPWQRGARRNGRIRRLHPLTLNFRLLDTRLSSMGQHLSPVFKTTY